MPIGGNKLSFQRRYSGPCPDCGGKWVINKTKDAGSRFLGWVECEDEACPYEASFDDFRAKSAASRRAASLVNP